ncbi:MAG: hypothetical protein ABSC60_18850 [Acidobacteriota bacterium]
MYSTGLVFRRPNYNNVRRCPFPVPRWITVIGIGIGIAIAIAIGIGIGIAIAIAIVN